MHASSRVLPVPDTVKIIAQALRQWPEVPKTFTVRI